MRSLLSMLPLLLVGSLFLAGCNVFEGIDQAGTSDPEVLLEDAERALQRDDPDEAVAHLRNALEHAPEEGLLRSRIEIKLATALLAARDIDVMMLRRIAGNFNQEDAGAAPAPLNLGKQAGTMGCKFPGSHSRTEFDPIDGIDYEHLSQPASQDAMDEARRLLGRVFALDEAAFCGTQEDFDHNLSLLQRQGLTDIEIAEALVDYAVVLSTRLTLELLNINDGSLARFFYVTAPSGGEYVSVCMNDVGVCEASDAVLTENLSRIDCAVRLLTSRAELLHSTGTAYEVAQMAASWQDRLVGGLDQPCYSVSF